jgi:hypothetical protein
MSDPTLSGESSVSSVIAELVRTTGPPAKQRELRAALSHADAELGAMPLRAVRSRNLTALLDDLEDAGLSARRQTAVVDALHALYGFAIARGLVPTDPVAEPARVRRRPPAPSTAALAEPAPPHTPTLTMVALGARVAVWTACAMTIVFGILLIALVIELA